MVTISHDDDENVFPNTVTINLVISAYVQEQEGNINHNIAKHQTTELASENDLFDAKIIDEKIVGENESEVKSKNEDEAVKTTYEKGMGESENVNMNKKYELSENDKSTKRHNDNNNFRKNNECNLNSESYVYSVEKPTYRKRNVEEKCS